MAYSDDVSFSDIAEKLPLFLSIAPMVKEMPHLPLLINSRKVSDRFLPLEPQKLLVPFHRSRSPALMASGQSLAIALVPPHEECSAVEC